MSEWKKVKLGKLCDITSSKRCLASERSNNGIPFYCSKEIILLEKGEEIRDSDYIPIELYLSIKEKYGVPITGDLLLTTRGTNGIPYIYKKHDCFYFADGNLSWFKNFKSDLDVKYLYYWFKSDTGKHIIDSIAKGTAQKAIPIDGLRNINISIPSIRVQCKISEILSHYDTLIENYQKQIKLLEESAQRLYKEWFVDLRFPGHENTKIVDGVPEGWKKKKLIDFTNIVMGQSPKSDFYNNDKMGLPFHQGVGSFSSRFVIDNVYSSCFTKIAESNSILFSVRAPVGRINITNNKVAIGRGLASINHKRGFQSFLYYLLKSFFFEENIIGNGAIFASISKDDLYNLLFLIPDEKLVMNFNKVVSEIDGKIKNISNQIYILTEARDRLLPKLMSGEIEV